MSSILKELLKLIEEEKAFAIEDVQRQLSALDAKAAGQVWAEKKLSILSTIQ